LFKRLATLRVDAKLFDDVEDLRWRGPSDAFAARTVALGNERLLARAHKIAAKLASP
jgi:hypothetical protein